MNTKPPNILIVHAHDMGRYNSIYGHPTPTPAMHAFAREGLTLRDAHCAAPTCSPSRAAMLTGLTAHETSVLGLVHRGFTLNQPDRHLARILAKAGYHTVRAGLQHEYAIEKTGELYDDVREGTHAEAERDLIVGEQAADFLSHAPTDQPWFLWVGFFYPHRDFLPHDPERHNPNHIAVPAPLPDTPETREDMADYHATVEVTDQAFAKVLAGLEASGQAENTLVILTTDHGIAFPDMKCNLTAHGTGVTWVLRLPNLIPAGLVSDSLVSHLDLVPTVLDLAGIPQPQELHGHSLRPLFSNPNTVIRDDLYAEVNLHAAADPMRMVRTKTNSYIRIFDPLPGTPMPNVDNGLAKSVWLEAGWTQRPRSEVSLFDLVFDPQERNNLADHPEHADCLQEMHTRLDTWMRRTSDPLLYGPLKIPKGSKLNSRSDISPKGKVFEH